jgi:hypothetical protein
MIQLAPSDAYAHLAKPPTHAKIAFLGRCFPIVGMPIPPGLQGMISLERVYVVYALGTLDAGAFVAHAHVNPVEFSVDLTDYSAMEAAFEGDPRPASFAERTSAARALLGKDVAPTPGAAHVARAAVGKPAGQFRDEDVDAIASHFEPRLAGTVM